MVPAVQLWLWRAGNDINYLTSFALRGLVVESNGGLNATENVYMTIRIWLSLVSRLPRMRVFETRQSNLACGAFLTPLNHNHVIITYS